MLRGNVTYSDWTWSKVPCRAHRRSDPAPGRRQPRRRRRSCRARAPASGAKAGVYINSKWAYSVNGLYQIAPDHPWGFNVALNLNGREGYPVPYYRRVSAARPTSSSPSTYVQVTNRPDSFRLDNIRIVDARVEKEFNFSDFGLTLGVDCFNLFNEGFVLQRQHRLQHWPPRTTSARSPARGSSVSVRASASADPSPDGQLRIESCDRRGATPGGFFLPARRYTLPAAHAACIPWAPRGTSVETPKETTIMLLRSAKLVVVVDAPPAGRRRPRLGSVVGRQGPAPGADQGRERQARRGRHDHPAQGDRPGRSQGGRPQAAHHRQERQVVDARPHRRRLGRPHREGGLHAVARGRSRSTSTRSPSRSTSP